MAVSRSEARPVQFFGSRGLKAEIVRALALTLLAFATVGAAGCTTYRPAPLSSAMIAQAQHSTRIDPKSVRSELKRLAPDYQWDGVIWNELTLLGAALTYNPDIAAARARLDAFDADVRAARIMPGLTLSLTAEYAFNPTESSPWLFGVASDFIAANGGRRSRVRAAEIARRGAEFDYLAVVWNVRMALRRAIDANLGAALESENSEALVNMRRRQFEAVRRQVDAGEASRLDLDLVRGDLAAALGQKTTADANIAGAQIDLAAALGVTPPSLDLRQLSQTALDLQEDWSFAENDRLAALSARPEILKTIADYDQAENALRSAVAAQYPEVKIGPGYTWERGLSRIPFAFTLSFPTTDLNAAAIHAAEARRLEAGRALEAAIASVAASIDRANADYGAAWAALAVMRLQVTPAAQAIAAQADREFQLGGIDRAEWAASQAGLAAAKLSEATAERAALDARSALEDALRRPLAGPELKIGAPLTPFAGDDQ